MKKRLSKTDWLDSGLHSLIRSGFPALKADLLAKELGVSRGSFYWHFEDVEAFHAAVLARWREKATEQVIAEVDQTGSSDEALRALVRKSMRADSRLETNVRTWAKHSEMAKNAVRGVDRARLSYIRRLLRSSGVEKSRAQSRALFLYWASLGRSMVIDARSTANRAELDELIDLLLSR